MMELVPVEGISPLMCVELKPDSTVVVRVSVVENSMTNHARAAIQMI